MQIKRMATLLLVVMFLVSCGGLGIKITGESSEEFAQYKAAYIKAAEEFDKSWEKYLEMWKIMPPEIQQRWTRELDPMFLDAADALDKWEDHVLYGQFVPTDADSYLKLKDQLFMMLIKEKIKEQEAK